MKPPTLAHRIVDAGLACLVACAMVLLLLVLGCDLPSLPDLPDREGDSADAAWCEALELALASCPIEDVDDHAAEQSQGLVAKGCTDVALAAVGHDEAADPQGRAYLWAMLMDCNGNYQPGMQCSDGLDACGMSVAVDLVAP